MNHLFIVSLLKNFQYACLAAVFADLAEGHAG